MRHIHFGYGGGLYVYYTGIAQALYDTVDHEVLKQCKIGGTSAGICAAMALLFSLYLEEVTPTTFFEDIVQNEVNRRAKCSKTGLYLTGHATIYDASVVVYHRYFKLLPSEIQKKLYCIVSNVPRMSPSREESFQNEMEFATCVSATMSVPLILNCQLWNNLGERRLCDGAFSTNRHYVSDEPDDEVVYFNAETSTLNDSRYRCVNVFAWVNSNLKFMLCRTDVNHASLFRKGCERALAHQAEWRHLLL